MLQTNMIIVDGNGKKYEFNVDEISIGFETVEVSDEPKDTFLIVPANDYVNIRPVTSTNNNPIGRFSKQDKHKLAYFVEDNNGFSWMKLANEAGYVAYQSLNTGYKYVKILDDLDSPKDIKFLYNGQYYYIDWNGDGQATPINMVNMRPLLYYKRGENDVNSPFPYSDFGRIEQIFKDISVKYVDVNGFGIHAIRCYLPHVNYTESEQFERFQIVADLAKKHGIKLLVVLRDSLAVSGHTIEADLPYHTVSEYKHLNNTYWRDKAYLNHFWPYVSRFLDRFGNHEAILALELENEPGFYHVNDSLAKPQYYFNYVSDIAARIKAKTPHIPLAIGAINFNHLHPNIKKAEKISYLHNELADIDIWSFHFYNEDVTDVNELWPKEVQCLEDVAAIQESGAEITYGVLEVGSNSDVLRSRQLRNKGDKWLALGAFTFAFWGLMFSPLGDDGTGDSEFGFDTGPNVVWFNDLRQMIFEYATIIFNLYKMPKTKK